MQIYLPIAETSVNIFLLLGLGGLVGFLSGMFGVGGGFLMTPLLIFVGIPPTVAVASEANQILASSISGGMAHFQKRGVDMRMGCVLLAGGLLGSAVGVQLYAVMREIGQIDLMISLCYVVFLGVIGLLMMIESIRAIHARQIGRHIPARRPGQHNWIHGLPFKMRFKVSHLYTSIIPPILIGFFVGILAAIMGVGGGFIMVPAMIYLLRMPTNVVIGTSLFQIIFVSAAVTIMHAVKNQTVDVVLATILIIGGVVGAQIGAPHRQKLRGEQIRAMLARNVQGVGLKMLIDLLFMPAEIYSLSSLGMMP
ncbi:MAG: sulfite exporter TauE/SafE family protein [Pseudomonadota bacterium]|nr:sulfite exporter TauE/SafE family protein [Pseudomonadota bacterium]